MSADGTTSKELPRTKRNTISTDAALFTASLIAYLLDSAISENAEKVVGGSDPAMSKGSDAATVSSPEEMEAALKQSTETMKRNYNRKKADSWEYKPGDKVWLEGTNITTNQPIKKLNDK